ncbi:hypothetical protein B0T16DRAFT_498658 [Cercophora newfieldiana]|uniref:Uncharacterized protein n=1 Tax=Cercophora newfieldiana TaxID=92897 RepID=A0AA39YM78_9PEZI|nr:hypothetical protein B0T16DRAFT_498658 [Cercophora newfieldiana]
MASIKCSVCYISVCDRDCFYSHLRRFHCHNANCALHKAETCIIDNVLCPSSYAAVGRAPTPPGGPSRSREAHSGESRREGREDRRRREPSHSRRERSSSRRRSSRDDRPSGSFRHINVDEERLRDRFDGTTRVSYRHVRVHTDTDDPRARDTPSNGYSTRYADPEMENLSRRFERTSVRDDERSYYRYETTNASSPPPPPPPSRPREPEPRRRRESRTDNERPARPEHSMPAGYSGYMWTEDPDGNIIDEADPPPCPSPPPAFHEY